MWMVSTSPQDSRMLVGVGTGVREPICSLLMPTQPPICLIIKLQGMFLIAQCFPARVRVTDGLVTAQTPINPVLELVSNLP